MPPKLVKLPHIPDQPPVTWIQKALLIISTLCVFFCLGFLVFAVTAFDEARGTSGKIEAFNGDGRYIPQKSLKGIWSGGRTLQNGETTLNGV